MTNKLEPRPATHEDIPAIRQLIGELADYEKLSGEAVASDSDLENALFGTPPSAHALIVDRNEIPAAFALYFYSFSTFVGRRGLYVEDIYVRPEYRGQGIGTALFRAIAGIARDQGCGRMEWSVLDWNAPSIAFYEQLGAQPMAGWTVYRLQVDRIAKLAEDIGGKSTQ
jgi:GNAT superfamily N-acetyltransferase